MANKARTVEQLRRGALLGSIAHATFVANAPELANEQSWDGLHYSVQNNEGARGTIAFTDGEAVGVFRDEDSPRDPIGRKRDDYDVEAYLKGLPASLRSTAAKEALQYVLDDLNGKVQPVITAAFWSEDGTLKSAEPWPEVQKHGARIIQNQLLEPDQSLKAWQKAYHLTPSQMDLVKSLFDRKMNKPTVLLTLSQKERQIVGEGGTSGWAEAAESFQEIGVHLGPPNGGKRQK